mmetsp:Transcript_23901/g.56462  ORF Transcript_23901/g.56462 Transcript_23901/m.56462 type:complete len:128 (+) Transcript_23901:1754-2137(+)
MMRLSLLQPFALFTTLCVSTACHRSCLHIDESRSSEQNNARKTGIGTSFHSPLNNRGFGGTQSICRICQASHCRRTFSIDRDQSIESIHRYQPPHLSAVESTRRRKLGAYHLWDGGSPDVWLFARVF